MAHLKERTVWLVDEKLDFRGSPPPKFFYIIGSVERSGSTFFCNRLWQTGILGAPGEYFNFHTIMVQMMVRLGVSNLDEYINRLCEVRTSPNGVFGMQLHWPHLQFLELATRRADTPNIRWILLDRRDHVAQAVSFAKAYQTRQWTSLAEPAGAPAYSFKTLRTCHGQLKEHRKSWQSFGRRLKTKPALIFYEDFITAPDAAADRVVKWLGFPEAPVASVSLPEVKRQSDEINAEWAERFRRDADREGYAL